MVSLRAILDTNVFVGAGFNRRSASAQLLQAVREGRLVMVWSRATRAETQRILEKIPPLSWGAVADLFDPANEAPDADPATADFVTDAEDRKFAALSLAEGCPIVTSDDDLLTHADKLDVFKPSTFWACFSKRA